MLCVTGSDCNGENSRMKISCAAFALTTLLTVTLVSPEKIHLRGKRLLSDYGQSGGDYGSVSGNGGTSKSGTDSGRGGVSKSGTDSGKGSVSKYGKGSVSKSGTDTGKGSVSKSGTDTGKGGSSKSGTDTGKGGSSKSGTDSGKEIGRAHV